jgi:hypothetical protein
VDRRIPHEENRPLRQDLVEERESHQTYSAKEQHEVRR